MSHVASLSQALPVESRPLLAVGDTGDEEDCRQRHHRHSSTVSSVHVSDSNTTPAVEMQQQQQQQSSSSVDWLTIARHTLADISRSLPEARSSELRVKSCDSVITKIEAAREMEQGPSLNRPIYHLPSDRASAGTEIGRARAAMEIVAERIRDAVAEDMRRRLLVATEKKINTMKASALRRQSEEEEAAAPLISNSRRSTLCSSVEGTKSDSPVPDAPAAAIAVADAVTETDRREQHHQKLQRQKSDVEVLMSTEQQQRFFIEQESSELLLELVAEFLRAFTSTATQQMQEHQQQQQANNVEQQQHQSTSPPRQPDIEAADAACDTDELDAAASALQEAVADEAAERMRQTQETSERSHRLTFSELETNARSIIEGWELDARRKMAVHTIELRRLLAAAQERTRLFCSFFETWRCFALKRREEHIRADKERHHRILQYTLDLQQSQINGSLDSIVLDHDERVGSFAQPAKNLYHRRGISPGGGSSYHMPPHEVTSVRSNSPGVSPVPMAASM